MILVSNYKSTDHADFLLTKIVVCIKINLNKGVL